MIFGRKHIALFFLFCTLIVQTPRVWLHECHDTEFDTYEHTGTSLEEDCDICSQPALLSDDIGNPEASAYFKCCYFSFPNYQISLPCITGGLTKNKAPPVLPC